MDGSHMLQFVVSLWPGSWCADGEFKDQHFFAVRLFSGTTDASSHASSDCVLDSVLSRTSQGNFRLYCRSASCRRRRLSSVTRVYCGKTAAARIPRSSLKGIEMSQLLA